MAMSIENPSINKSTETPSPLLTMENVRKNISHQEIAYILFKDEIDKNPKLIDGQRIRLTCKPAVQKILQPHFLNILRCHAINSKEARFIDGYDSTWMEYYEFEEYCHDDQEVLESVEDEQCEKSSDRDEFEKFYYGDLEEYLDLTITHNDS